MKKAFFSGRTLLVLLIIFGVSLGLNYCEVAPTTPSGQVTAPIFSIGGNPATGGTYASEQSVTISTTTSGASIRYAIDGSTPSSTVGTTYSGAITVSTTTTIKAIAYLSGMTDSTVVTADFIINTPTDNVVAPTFSPPAGAVASNTVVTISSTTAGANFYYTTDGSTPDYSGTGTQGSSVVVSLAMTIKAVARKTDWIDSSVASASYTLKKVYWTDNGTNKIQRSNLDGTSVEDLVTGLSTPYGIAVDSSGGKIYWVDLAVGKIQRANLDGTFVEDLVTGLDTLIGIAVDSSGGKIYWVDLGTKKIQRSNLDGTFVEDLVTGLSTPYVIAVDSSGGKIYWTDNGTKKIQRSNLDGTFVEDLVTGLDSLYGIAVDSSGGKIYWVDNGTKKIQRSDLDGTSVEDIATGLSDPFYNALSN